MPFVRLWGLSSFHDKLCYLGRFLWLVDNMTMNTEISETSKHDFVFSYLCSGLLLLLRLRVHPRSDCGCVFLDFCWPLSLPSAAVKHDGCQPGCPAPETPSVGCRTGVIPSLCCLTSANWGVCASTAGCPLSDRKTLFPVLYKSN